MFELCSLGGSPSKFYRVERSEIVGRNTSKPQHHIILIDLSSSMESHLGTLKQALNQLIQETPKNRYVSLLSYGSMGDVHPYFTHEEAGDVDLSKIDGMQVKGLTCISQALEHAKSLIRQDEQTFITLHSDGCPNDRSPRREFAEIEAISSELADCPNLTLNTIAYGSNPDYRLLASVAHKLGGVCASANHKTLSSVLQSTLPSAEIDFQVVNPEGASYVIARSSKRVWGGTAPLHLQVEDTVQVYRLYPASSEESSPDPKLALSLVISSIGEGAYNTAKAALLSSGQKDLIQRHRHALTPKQMAELAEAAKKRLFSELLLEYAAPTKDDSLSLLEVLTHLNHPDLRVDMDSLWEDYSPVTLKRIAGTRDEQGKVIPPKYTCWAQDESKAKLVGFDLSQTSASVTMKVAQDVSLVDVATGNIIHEVSGIPLDLTDFNSFSIVKDGDVRVSSLRVYMSDKRTHRALMRAGLISGDFEPAQSYEISLNRPLIPPKEGVPLTREGFLRLARLKGLSSLLHAYLKNTSRRYVPKQIKELAEYHITPSLNFSPPTTTAHPDLKQALRDGEVGVRYAHRISVGIPEMNSLSKLPSVKKFLQRRFVHDKKSSHLKDKRWRVKKLSSRVKLQFADEILFPLYADLLMGEGDALIRCAHTLGLEYFRRGEESLRDLMDLADNEIKRVIDQSITPTVFHIGATGARGMTVKEAFKSHPNIILNKSERSDGLIVPLPDGIIATVCTTTEYYSL